MPITTPFQQPFSLGLQPLAAQDWLQIDTELEPYLIEKETLYAAHPERVLAQEKDTLATQEEVLTALLSYLPQRYPNIYQPMANAMLINDNRRVMLTEDMPPILTAARLIPDDLVLMRKSAQGWRLVAACVSFPSSWTLLEKFGKAITEIHKPVPGFNQGTRHANMIERVFDNLQVQRQVWRSNWSLYTDAALYHPSSETESSDRFNDEALIRDPFIRTERQTLTKMPLSNDILFTIKIDAQRLSALSKNSDTAKNLRLLAQQLEQMNEAERAYKGLHISWRKIVDQLLLTATTMQ